MGRERAVPAVSLRLDRMERYLHGPTPASASRYTSTEDAMAALHNITEQISSWRDSLTAVSVIDDYDTLTDVFDSFFTTFSKYTFKRKSLWFNKMVCFFFFNSFIS